MPPSILSKVLQTGQFLAFQTAPEELDNGDLKTFILTPTYPYQCATQGYTPIPYQADRYRFHKQPESFEAKFLAWAPNTLQYVTLDDEDEVLITPQLNGCVFAILQEHETGKTIACHINYETKEKPHNLFIDPDPLSPSAPKPDPIKISSDIDTEPKKPSNPGEQIAYDTSLSGAVLPAEQYELDEEGEIMMYSEIPKSDREKGMYSDALPSEGDEVYVKNHKHGYEKKIYSGYGLPQGRTEGETDTELMLEKLEEKFPLEKYDCLYLKTKKDYQDLVSTDSSMISIAAIRNTNGEWSCFLCSYGPRDAKSFEETLPTTAPKQVTGTPTKAD